MGKYLRPRRGNENEAIRANIKLWNGEVFFEYPEGRGIGKSPGRIIIGNGNDTYQEKENVTDDPTKFQPFITDPSIYAPLHNDFIPKEDYKYDDEDRGTTVIGRWLVGFRKLPEILGYIKEILCEHIDNLKYDDYRIKDLNSTFVETTNKFNGDISTLFNKTEVNANDIVKLNSELNNTADSLTNSITTLGTNLYNTSVALDNKINSKADFNNNINIKNGYDLNLYSSNASSTNIDPGDITFYGPYQNKEVARIFYDSQYPSYWSNLRYRSSIVYPDGSINDPGSNFDGYLPVSMQPVKIVNCKKNTSGTGSIFNRLIENGTGSAIIFCHVYQSDKTYVLFVSVGYGLTCNVSVIYKSDDFWHWNATHTEDVNVGIVWNINVTRSGGDASNILGWAISYIGF